MQPLASHIFFASGTTNRAAGASSRKLSVSFRRGDTTMTVYRDVPPSYDGQSLSARDGAGSPIPLVCFCHLRWGFVWQRPQHLLTRIGKIHPVYLIEEPQLGSPGEEPNLLESRDAGVTILTPVLPSPAHPGGGFDAENNLEIRSLLSRYFRDELEKPDVIAWYYTPMAYGALPPDLNPTVTVFDAMDELSKFRGAPKALRDQERLLMQTADLVFAGGPSLHESRKFRHPRAFCFPSGVEADHFRRGETDCPADIAGLPGPIVGFYGVLDERIDFDLVGGIADARPEWSILMIGPQAKISESDLACRPNIHYLGMRSYDELPHYLAHFDAAILPFALNEATRFISPTKTLEYLAGGKPVVSTAIKDVVDLYGEVIEVASTPEAFVEGIERLWNEPVQKHTSREVEVERILAQHDWDNIAVNMLKLIHEAQDTQATFEALLRDAEFLAAAGLPYSQEVAD
jgi:UDP-galactopyranose mutase